MFVNICWKRDGEIKKSCVHIDKLLRAIIGIVIFMSSYMAEAVRGGIQAIPQDQFDAALTESGLEQALAVRSSPMRPKVDLVISSSLRRAIQRIRSSTPEGP